MPAIGSTLANVLAASPKAPPAVARKAQPQAGGKLPLDTALFNYHQQRKANSHTMTFPMAEGARLFNVKPDVANMQAFAAWFNQCDRPGVVGPKTYVFSPNASITKESPNDKQRLLQVQQGLARRGYPVQGTGTFDSATEQAVVSFKRAQGFHDGFYAGDGRPATSPFADERVQAALARQ